MCTEYVIKTMWSGGGCRMGKCDKTEYIADNCGDKPAEGIRHCYRYRIIYAASSRKKGPRPGHDHGLSMKRSMYCLPSCLHDYPVNRFQGMHLLCIGGPSGLSYSCGVWHILGMGKR